jgi:hypothetical protein
MVIANRPPEVHRTSNPSVSCHFEASTPLLLIVRVRNRLGSQLNASVIPAVHMRSVAGAFWAPFALDESSLPMNSPDSLGLGSKEEQSYTLQLDGLLWAKTNSSLWPAHSLRAVVPSGTYRVTVELSGSNLERPEVRWLSSGACGSVVLAPLSPARGGA